MPNSAEEKNALRAKIRSILKEFDNNPEIRKVQAEHPTQVRLARGMTTRILAVLEAVLVDEQPGWQTTLAQRAGEITEIESWFSSKSKFSASYTPDDTLNQELVRSWMQAGLNAVQAVTLVLETAKQRRARPVTRRVMAVRALDLKLAISKSTGSKPLWRELADGVCDCGLRARHKHDSPCCAILRQEVMRLGKLLKKYNL